MGLKLEVNIIHIYLKLLYRPKTEPVKFEPMVLYGGSPLFKTAQSLNIVMKILKWFKSGGYH